MMEFTPRLAASNGKCVSGRRGVVAPATEQSGVGHSITYLTPLIVKEVFRNEGGPEGERRWGWAVEGSPADCVKIGILQFCPRPPDLVVSGINGGLNAGINVLYSGTVAAAIEGAFFGITSVAVSLEFDEHARFDKAARLAREIVRRILDQKGRRAAALQSEHSHGRACRHAGGVRRADERDPLRRHVSRSGSILGAANTSGSRAARPRPPPATKPISRPWPRER